MFKTVLVSLDGSPQAAAALPLARTLARAANASLVLVRVARDDDVSGAAMDYLKSVLVELNDAQARPVVRSGHPAEEIIAAAAGEQADLIVMSTHGRVGLQRVLLGSVAQEVVSRSSVPVVLLTPGGKRVSHLQTVVVPTDGTAGAALALAYAVDLARTSGARLVLAQAIEPVPVWAYGDGYAGVAPAYIDPAWEEEALAAAESYIKHIVGRLESAGVQAEGQARIGNAVRTIEAIAEERDADLILMSTHALTGPARTLLGSTADALVRTSRRPVLLVRRRFGPADSAMAPTSTPAVASSS